MARIPELESKETLDFAIDRLTITSKKLKYKVILTRNKLKERSRNVSCDKITNYQHSKKNDREIKRDIMDLLRVSRTFPGVKESVLNPEEKEVNRIFPLPDSLPRTGEYIQILFPKAAAISPSDGQAGHQATAFTAAGPSPAAETGGSMTCWKKGPTRVSWGERGEGKWEMTRREAAP